MENAAAQRMEMKMQFEMMNNCFKDCVNNFSAGELNQSEKSCLTNCGVRSAQTMQLFAQVSQQLSQRQGGMGSF